MSDKAWEDMLEEFRALGGTADNICLRNGIYGRGVFPVDPGKPIAIHVPESLLIDTAHARFENGQFGVGPDSMATPRERAFVKTYENDFSWGAGGRVETEQILEQAQRLPAQLRETLRSQYRFGDWFEEPTDERVQTQFLDSRCISYRDRTVLMPILELINHDSRSWSVRHLDTTNGLSFGGTFSGEVLARYGDTDAIGAFANWGFASEQPQAFSIALKSESDPVTIGRDLASLSQKTQYWVPKVQRKSGEVALQFLMMGNARYPRMCKGIFYKLMRDAGIADIEETFDRIQHTNLLFATNLLSLVEAAEGAMAGTLRRVARFQLQALSNCFGARAL